MTKTEVQITYENDIFGIMYAQMTYHSDDLFHVMDQVKRFVKDKVLIEINMKLIYD